MGMFYKRRDYTKIVNGRNPIVAHEFLGSSVEGKDVLIIDDMISSGESMLDVAKGIKSAEKQEKYLSVLLSVCSPADLQSLTSIIRMVSLTVSLLPTWYTRHQIC